eukprot:Sspe_Gene.47122::Locus_23805_Transcript_6_6_Confidence_0.364_Length_418::g.47122::m.47122
MYELVEEQRKKTGEGGGGGWEGEGEVLQQSMTGVRESERKLENGRGGEGGSFGLWRPQGQGRGRRGMGWGEECLLVIYAPGPFLCCWCCVTRRLSHVFPFE